MTTQPARDRLHRTRRRLAAGVCAAAVFAVPAAVVHADNVPSCFSPASAAYSMELTALTGPAGADLHARHDRVHRLPLPDSLKKVELTVIAPDGSKDALKFTQVAAPAGVARIDLGPVPRDRRISANVLVQTGTPERTYVVRGDTTTHLRPDLVVAGDHRRSRRSWEAGHRQGGDRRAERRRRRDRDVTLSAIPARRRASRRSPRRPRHGLVPASTFARRARRADGDGGRNRADRDRRRRTTPGRATVDITEHQLATPVFRALPVARRLRRAVQPPSLRAHHGPATAG